MDVADSAGAEAVAMYFLQLYPYVYATNDLTEWRALSHPECVFCASVIQGVEEQVAAGNWSDGGLVEIESVAGVEVSDGFYSVEVIATQGPSAEYGPDGGVVEQSEGSRSLLTLVIVTSDSGWLVRATQVDEPPAA